MSRDLVNVFVIRGLLNLFACHVISFLVFQSGFAKSRVVGIKLEQKHSGNSEGPAV